MKVRTLYEHDGHTVEFIKLDGSSPGLRPIPGYSHRVIIDGASVGFLADDKDSNGRRFFRPSPKTARFFLNKLTGRAAMTINEVSKCTRK